MPVVSDGGEESMFLVPILDWDEDRAALECLRAEMLVQLRAEGWDEDSAVAIVEKELPD